MASIADIITAIGPVAGQAAAGYATGRMLGEDRRRQREAEQRQQFIEEARNDLILEQLRLANEAARRKLDAPTGPIVTRTGIDPAGVPVQVQGRWDEVSGLDLRPAPSKAEDGINWQTVQTDQGLVQVNPRTGQTRPLGLQAPPRATGSGRPITEGQAKMQVALSRAEPALRTIEAFLGYDPETDTFAEGGGRVPEESFIGRITPGRYFQSPEIQAYDQAAEAIASAILRIESGAAISAQEIESYRRQFIPQPGDKPEVIRQKLHALRTTLDAIRRASGVEGAPGAAMPDRPAASPSASTAPRNPFR